MNANTPLVNLALLEAMKGQYIRDEIDIFIPYLVLSICKIDNESFDIQDVKEKFASEFSITPPEPALQVILTRAKKQGFIRLHNHQYFKIPDKLNEIEATSKAKRIEIHRSLTTLITEFKNYTKIKHSAEISDDEAESFLYKYITTNISAFVDVLSGNSFSVKTKIKNKDHLTASFIAYLNKDRTDKLSYLDNLVKGILLANYITLADKITPKSSFENITIYLDTPIILGLLGYSGPVSKRSLTEFLNLIASLKIRVCVFEVTIDEIERIFGAWIDDLNKKEYSKFNPKTLELLRAKNLDAIALETERKLIESKIEQLQITINTSFSINKKYQCDEVALEDFLREAGLNKNLRHDITCISRINNSREDKLIKSFATKFCIFASLNSVLERSANKFFLPEINSSRTIPIVSSEKWLATVLWLKKPNLFTDLPANLLLSHAYSTIYSDDIFWKSFIKRLSDLEKREEISERDFTLVRWDKNLIEKIHDISIETGADFKDDDIFDVIESIKKEQTEIYENKLFELEAAKDKELSYVIREKEIAEHKNIFNKRKIKNISSGVSHFVASILFLLTTIVLVYSLYLATPNVPFFDKKMMNYDTLWLTFFIAFLIFANLISMIFGWSFIKIYVWIQTKLEAQISNFFEN